MLQLVCRQPARVIVDSETVAIHFALATHPLAVRLAGLDRDPGWLPEARRTLRFVFA